MTALKQKKTSTGGSKRSPRSALKSDTRLSMNRSDSTGNWRPLPSRKKFWVTRITEYRNRVQGNDTGCGNSHRNESATRRRRSEEEQFWYLLFCIKKLVRMGNSNNIVIQFILFQGLDNCSVMGPCCPHNYNEWIDTASGRYYPLGGKSVKWMVFWAL